MKPSILFYCALVVLLIETGCAETPPPQTAKSAPAAVNSPPPDPALWASKDLPTAAADHIAAAAEFVKAAKKIQSAADVPANKANITVTAQILRVCLYALSDLAKKTPLKADQLKAFDDATAPVSEQVARLLEIPEAKQELRDAFLLIRFAPSPK